MMETET
jgi:hypothetical protein